MNKIWTKNLESPTSLVEFEKRKISLDYDLDQAKPIEVTVPKNWSVLAGEILARKYLKLKNETEKEDDVRDVCLRMAKAWSFWGWELGYFDDEESRVFEDEILYTLIHQIAAPNSPQWFNTGLYHSYGIEGEALGHWFVDTDGIAQPSLNAYEHPQAHACFIQSVKSDLVREDGLLDLWSKEARLFKQGSGTGTNFSNIPAANEPLPGGGYASGLIGFLKVGDASAAAVRSGGVTRRAAKMVILDIDHPDIIEFIQWKLHEERKVAALIAGSEMLSKRKDARLSSIEVKVFDGDFNGEGYSSVSGQNSNNSVRISSKFFEALEKKKDWKLISRLDKSRVSLISPDKIWNDLCQSAWECADPGVQFSDNINYFHTCKSDGEILASNPCSEYFFLDDTGCNLASLNLLKFVNEENNELLVDKLTHTIKLYTTILDITVDMAQYPSQKIAQRSHHYRTLGLGFANLGSLLMTYRLAYDSNEARAVAATLTSFITATAYEQSILLAKKLGQYKGYNKNKKSHLKVLDDHFTLTKGQNITQGNVVFQSINKDDLPEAFRPIYQACIRTWERVCEQAKKDGLRNAQVSVIAPTGTIGLLMDCETTGIEPEYALIKNKKLVGGKSAEMINRTFVKALENLNYNEAEVLEIKKTVLDSGNIINSKILKKEHLSIFETALGSNSISALGHLKMVAACTPFVSGGISKTINLPKDATVEDISFIYKQAFHLGVKSISLYRDGCKLSQPLNSMEKQNHKCPKCGNYSLVSAGTCYKCENCGESTSCS